MTVTIEATMTLTGSKCGERHIELTIEKAYTHTAMLTVIATPDQDDDALTEALEPAFAAGHARIVASIDEHGSLICGSDGITAAA